MNQNSDLIDLLRALNAADAKYLTTIDGVDFERAWNNRSDSHYGDVPVHFIGRDDLVANKSATGRPQDELDVRSLLDFEGDSA